VSCSVCSEVRATNRRLEASCSSATRRSRLASSSSLAFSERRGASRIEPWLRSNTGSGMAMPTTAWVRPCSLTRLAPRLTTTSGLALVRSTSTRARRRSNSRRLIVRLGEFSS
jgi:hypothetical protein